MASYIDGLYKGSSRGIGGQVNVSIIVEGGAVTDCILTRCKETSGIGGRVDVRATFKGGELAAFELTRNKETDGIGFQAAPIVAQAIADAGTYEGVDIVTGATVSSSAVLAAARGAFDAASGAAFYEAYLQEQAASAAAGK